MMLRWVAGPLETIRTIEEDQPAPPLASLTGGLSSLSSLRTPEATIERVAWRGASTDR